MIHNSNSNNYSYNNNNSNNNYYYNNNSYNSNNNNNIITIPIHHVFRWRTLYRAVSAFMFLRWETTVSTVRSSTTTKTSSSTNTMADTNLSSSESRSQPTTLLESTLLSTSILLGHKLTKQRGHHLRPGGVTTHSFLILIVKIYKIFFFANSGYFVINICTWIL